LPIACGEYAGRIVEQSQLQMFDEPKQPYKRPLACVPTLQPDRHRLIAIPARCQNPRAAPARGPLRPTLGTYRLSLPQRTIPARWSCGREDRAVACIRADELVAS